ncbi:MAG: molybdopterin molybdotransferase [Verrucomicrobiota bacterium]
MISEEEARAKILETIAVLPARHVDLDAALNCFAANDVRARLPLPLFDNSAMDGYAVMAGGNRYRVVGEQPAGLHRQLRVNAGEAVRIFTGAPIPSGANAVVMQEDVARDGEYIAVNCKIDIGDFIRRRGCDLSEGQRILGQGERITATKLALLASQGIVDLAIGGEVTAAVISTGDELVRGSAPLQSGQIYDSNSTLLAALVRGVDARVAFAEHCPDELETLTRSIERASKQRVLLISGGVSVGEHDLVRRALENLGAKIDIWRVAIKPGKPFLFARLNDCIVFGLPGNPVSVFVTFLRFVRPAIWKLAGACALAPPTFAAELDVDLANDDAKRPHYVRGKLFDGKFSPSGRQESHALFGLSQANALGRIEAGKKLGRGDKIDIEIWI